MRTYKDDCPPHDHDCLRCGSSWIKHNGWACPIWKGQDITRTKVPVAYSYMSERMMAESAASHARDSGLPELTSAIQVESNLSDLSDWKAWRDINRQPGECPCGIRRSQCRYH